MMVQTEYRKLQQPYLRSVVMGLLRHLPEDVQTLMFSQTPVCLRDTTALVTDIETYRISRCLRIIN